MSVTYRNPRNAVTAAVVHNSSARRLDSDVQWTVNGLFELKSLNLMKSKVVSVRQKLKIRTGG